MSNPADSNDDTKTGVSRRSFLQKASVGAAVAATVGVTGVPAFAKGSGQTADRAATLAARNKAIQASITPSTGGFEGYTRIEDVWGPHYAHVQPGLIRDAYAKPNGLAGLLQAGTASRSTRPGSTTSRSRRARTGSSASSSAPAARLARWASSTSRCSRL